MGILLSALLVLMTVLFASCSKPAGYTSAAVEFVQSMADGKFADATAQFDAVMKGAMSTEQLKTTWDGVVGQCGAFKRIGETRTAKEGGFDCVYVPCEFEKVTLDVKVVYDADGKIGGLWFVAHVAAEDAKHSPPPYARQDAFDEREVTVGAGEWKLPGTLAMPKGDGPFPAVVLVHGSGPNDRDETLAANKPFKDLAWGLASQGIAVLRYDKRTKVYPAKLAGVANFTVKEETIDDAVAAANLLRTTAKIDPKRVFVLGHSLGGMLIPRIGKADPKLAGLIVAAGPTRPMEEIIIEQMEYLTSNGSTPEGKKKLDEVRREVAKAMDPNLSPTAPPILGAPGSYWLDLRGYKPAEAAKSLKQPMLIIQGGRDYQATTAEYDGWVKALSGRPNVTLKLYPDLNHLFMTGTGKSVPDEYNKRVPVDEKVVEEVARWVKGR